MYNRRRGLWVVGVLMCALFAVLQPTKARAETEHRWRGGHGSVTKPLVIAHRGASGYLPEHTLEAYALAIELGADYIEPDLVATKDGVLIARHEPNLIATTNVKDIAKFANRRTRKVVDGVEEEGFFASDFTYAEIRELRAVQAFGERSQAFNGRFEVPTFDEVINLAQRKAREEGRVIGVYPETKHPTYHQKLGLPLEDRVLHALQRQGWNHRGAPVFIQSFEQSNLKYLRTRSSVRLVQLIDADAVAPDGSIVLAVPYDKPYDWAVSGRNNTFADLLTPAGLAEVRTYADGIGPWKPYLISVACIKVVANACADANGDGLVNDSDRRLMTPSNVVAEAKKQGLLVHPYTFRNEPRRLASDFKGNPLEEYLAFYMLGVDGLFTDFTDTAVAARAQFILEREPDAAKCLVHGRRGGGACRDVRWMTAN